MAESQDSSFKSNAAERINCAKCGFDIPSPGDWGCCYNVVDCLERRVVVLEKKIEKLEEDALGDRS